MKIDTYNLNTEKKIATSLSFPIFFTQSKERCYRKIAQRMSIISLNISQSLSKKTVHFNYKEKLSYNDRYNFLTRCKVYILTVTKKENHFSQCINLITSIGSYALKKKTKEQFRVHQKEEKAREKE